MDVVWQTWASLLGLSGDSPIDTSIATLLLTAVLAVFGKLLKWVWEFANAIVTSRQKRRRTLVDLIIFMHFLEDSIQPYLVPAQNPKKDTSWLEGFERTIKREKNAFRPFTVVVNESTALSDIQAIRHQFRPRDIARIDAYVAQAVMFLRYFESMGSDEFVELSAKRKLAVAKNLCQFGRDTIAASASVRQNVLPIKDLARDLPLGQIFAPQATQAKSPRDGKVVKQSGEEGLSSVENPKYGNVRDEK